MAPSSSPLLAAALASAALLATPRAAAASPSASFATGPAPPWVTPVAVEPTSGGSTDGLTNGRRNLLVDHQVRVSAGREQSYFHAAERIVNESGLQAASQVNIDFDPSYQRLTIHGVVVRRGGETLDRLDRGAIHLVQRAPNLEAQVYDERLSAVLFLADLRVGDVVEWSFSTDGVDPSLGGRYVDAMLLGASEPVDRVHERVLVPRTRHVEAKGHTPDGSDATPEIVDRGDTRELTWDRADVPAYEREADAPSSFEVAPYAELSEFRSWQEVAALGTALFDVPSRDARAVKAWAGEAQRAAHSREELVLRAARFVQDEIRYVAIEVGMSRRRPVDPATTLRRRYGDCKDKTALLVALLRAVQVPAWPVLVSTGLDAGLDGHLPSPTLFDHAIVKATLDGKDYWIDPTASLQGGPLERALHSPFARGLTLDRGTTVLDRMTPEPQDEPTVAVHDTFRVAMPGTDVETPLDSERTYRNGVADGMRGALKARSLEKVGEEYLELYRREFPAIHVASPVEVSDDRDRDELRVVAHFAIPRFWSTVQGPRPYYVEITALPLDALLTRPKASRRSMPLALPFPLVAHYDATLSLPFDLALKPDDTEVDTATFHYSYAASYAARHLHYRYALATRTDAVQVAGLAEHFAALDRARVPLVRSLSWAPPLPDGPQWVNIAILVAAAAAIAWGARYVSRFNPAPRRPAQPDPRFAGLGGWLVLLGIGLGFSPLRNVVTTVTSAKVLYSAAAWGNLTTPMRPGYHPSLAVVCFAESFVNLAMTAYSVVVLIAFFGKRRSFPLHFRIMVLTSIGYRVVDDLAVQVLSPGTEPELAALVQLIVYALVWTLYLHLSRRAAATFVQ